MLCYLLKIIVHSDMDIPIKGLANFSCFATGFILLKANLIGLNSGEYVGK